MLKINTLLWLINLLLLLAILLFVWHFVQYNEKENIYLFKYTI